ncbi:hypothetical protein BGZ83_008284 [Gryganskiella cystojenkinii]|nr:hypothetical protein BGZ83_008284 [Gryganskiella cystojenkinii]
MHRCPSLLRSVQRTFSLSRTLPCRYPTTTTTSRTTLTPTLSHYHLHNRSVQHLQSRRLYTSGVIIENEKEATVKPRPRIPRNPHKSVKWTPKMDETVLSLRKEDKTWDYVALVVGRPASACSDRYYTCLDPAIKFWTPAMFSKLDEMVEAGYAWKDIAIALNSVIITCQHQWRTLGKGKYRISGLGMSIRAKANDWTPIEVDSFWRSFLQYGQGSWELIAADVHSKSVEECRVGFKALVLAALKDAPGWAKIEINNYVTHTSRKARQRAQVAERIAEGGSDSTASTASTTTPITETAPATKIKASPVKTWTEADHKALLEAVEKYGLFSGWTKIRKEVKPRLRDDQVEAEYYRLNGVMDSQEANEDDRVGSASSISSLAHHTASHSIASTKSDEDGIWTDEELETLFKMLMRYSTVPVWQEEADLKGYRPTEQEEIELFWPASEVKKQKKKTRQNKREVKLLQQQLEEQLLRHVEDEEIDTDKSDINEHGNNGDDTQAECAPKTPAHLEWTKDRVDRLKRLVGQQRLQGQASGHPVDWNWIADHIGPGFDANMCIAAWQSTPKKDITKLEPAKYWDESDIEKLMQGVRTYGRAWSKIKKQFLTDRTTDSIRRKVSNLEKSRNHLVRETKKMIPKESYLTEKDITAFVDDALKDYETYALCKKLDQLFEEYLEKSQSQKKHFQEKEEEEETVLSK